MSTSTYRQIYVTVKKDFSSSISRKTRRFLNTQDGKSDYGSLLCSYVTLVTKHHPRLRPNYIHVYVQSPQIYYTDYLVPPTVILDSDLKQIVLESGTDEWMRIVFPVQKRDSQKDFVECTSSWGFQFEFYYFSKGEPEYGMKRMEI